MPNSAGTQETRPERAAQASCRRPRGPLKEVPYEGSYLLRLIVQREVAGIENMNFRIGHVPPVRIGFRDLERRIVLAPHNQSRRLVLLEPCLPGRITRDVGAVVVEQIALDVGLAGTA